MDARAWRDLTTRLAPGQRELVDGLMAMLDRLKPPQLTGEEMTFERTGEVLTITLPHHTRTDFAVRIEATARGAAVSFGHARKEIYAFEGYTQNRSWGTLVVSLVEEVLRGRREIRTTFIGKTPVRVEVYEVARTGEISLLSDDTLRRRARDWRPFARAMTEVTRVSYMEPLAHI